MERLLPIMLAGILAGSMPKSVAQIDHAGFSIYGLAVIRQVTSLPWSEAGCV